jgi:ATPase subunit of ABC transporter with duplicated ATPase domains
MVESRPSNSYRVNRVRSQYDLRDEVIRERFTGALDVDDDWQIGVITGPSGSGKSSIARQLWPTEIKVKPGPWKSSSVVDDLPGDDDDVFRMLHRVGFGSIPSWLKPFGVLSMGEQMRVETAWRLLSPADTVVVDEFSSTVDRDIARFACVAIRKAIQASGKQFVAVSCHRDFIDWLAPDWVLDTRTMQVEKKKSGQTCESNSKSLRVPSQHGRNSVVITICRTRCRKDAGAMALGGRAT